MNDWLEELVRRLSTGDPTVRVTVLAARGSVPRDIGTSMLVGAATQWGTIGGGHLEWCAMHTARELLAPTGVDAAPGAAPQSRRDRYALGASLGQCCGGAMELALERFDASDLAFLDTGRALRERARPLVLASRWDGNIRLERAWIPNPEPSDGSVDTPCAGFEACRAAIDGLCAAGSHDQRARLLNASSDLLQAGATGAAVGQREEVWIERVDPAAEPLWIFGAGHVARALVPILASLPFRVRWIDDRESACEVAVGGANSICPTLTDDPVAELRGAPDDAIHLVMTHNHDLDYAICRTILERGAFRRLGLIGSETKARRFRQRLTAHGIAPRQLARLTSPIGIEGIHNKLPAAIAVSVAAQLLQWIEPGRAERRLAAAQPQSLSTPKVPA